MYTDNKRLSIISIPHLFEGTTQKSSIAWRQQQRYLFCFYSYLLTQ